MYTILLFLIGPFYKMSMEEANCGAASPGIYITSAHPSRRLLTCHLKVPNNLAGNPQQLLARGRARLLGTLSNSLTLNGSLPRLHLLRLPLHPRLKLFWKLEASLPLFLAARRRK